MFWYHGLMDVVQKESAGGIVYHDGKVLAIKALPYDEIVFPKGTMEQGETSEETAIREVAEETGYQTKVTAKLDDTSYEFTENGQRYHKVVHFYLLTLTNPDAEPTPNRREGEDFENVWLGLDEAGDKLTHDENRQLLQQAAGLISAS